jgi:hypothetical protein
LLHDGGKILYHCIIRRWLKPKRRQLVPKKVKKAEVKNYYPTEFLPTKLKPGYALPMIVSTSCHI